MPEYSYKPIKVPEVKTRNRKIVTELPVPESLPLFEKMKQYEPVSMMGQPPIIWDRAEGINVYDQWGNMWLDWSSGVLITNAGHGRKQICKSLMKLLKKPFISSYVFPHKHRICLVEMLNDLSPKKTRYKTFLLSTGSEATENCIKLAVTYGIKKGGKRKYRIVSFEGAFHGRTLGAQLAGGIPAMKEWAESMQGGFLQTPFPDGYRNPETGFDQFLKTLSDYNLSGEDIAGVISESYQGIGPHFFPEAYAAELEAWCRENDAVLIMDEVQSGFGRTGKMFAFQHYGIEPDLIACGKGLSSSLPVSAVIGRSDIMDLYAPGSMTSTHSGSPLPVVSAIENLKIIESEKLVDNAARLSGVLQNGLEKIGDKYPDRIGAVISRGLVAGLLMVKPGGKDPDGETAYAINESCFRKGLLMFSPVGLGGACVKIAPPLCIGREALEEGISVLEQACKEVLG
jgi:4-aminobutyrate aminotransferase-like enzyme